MCYANSVRVLYVAFYYFALDFAGFIADGHRQHMRYGTRPVRHHDQVRHYRRHVLFWCNMLMHSFTVCMSVKRKQN